MKVDHKVGSLRCHLSNPLPEQYWNSTGVQLSEKAVTPRCAPPHEKLRSLPPELVPRPPADLQSVSSRWRWTDDGQQETDLECTVKVQHPDAADGHILVFQSVE